MGKNKTYKELLEEVGELRVRLEEAEETLHAIRSGEVDALVVSGEKGDQIFTLKSAEQPYRLLIEEIKEGAVILAGDDTIIYSNRGFADMLKIPLEKMTGVSIHDFVLPVYQPSFDALLQKGRRGNSRGEITFTASEISVPVQLSINNFQVDGVQSVGLIITDLTHRKQAEEALRKARDELEIRVDERTDQLRESEQRYATTLAGIGDAVIATDVEGRITFMNAVAENLTGWTMAEASAQPLPTVFKIINEQTREAVEDPVSRVIKSGIVVGLANHTILVRKNGTEVPIDDSGAPIKDREGMTMGVVLIFRDITERKRAEEALARNSRRVSEILESITDGFMAIDNSWRFTYINQRAADNVGSKLEDLIGQNIWEKFPAIKGTDHEIYYRKAMQQHEAQHFEMHGVLTDKWYEIRVYPSAEGISVFWQDITRRKRMAEAFIKSNRQLDLLSYTATMLLAGERPQQMIEDLCQKVLRSMDFHVFFNYLVDEKKRRLHLNAFGGVPQESASEIEWLDYGAAVCGCAARNGCRIVCENISGTPDPRTELVRSLGIKAYACHPLFSGGRIIGTLSFGTRSKSSFTKDELAVMNTVAGQVAIAMERTNTRTELERQVLERTAELVDSNKALHAEIAERRQAEDALKIERQRFNDILELMPVYLVLLTTDYHVTFANRFFRERFGESQGRRCFEYLFGRSEPCEICETFTVLKTTEPHHWEWTGPDRRNYDIFDFPFIEADGTTFIMEMGIDITGRKKAEEALRMAHDKLEIRVKERTAELARANEELESEIIERRKIEEELRESEEKYRNLFDNANDAVITVDLKDRITSWNRSAERIFGWKAREVIGRKLGKLMIPSDLDDSWELITSEALAGKDVSGMETTRIRKDGSRINVSLTLSPIINAHRDIIGLAGVIRDITERKKIEEIRLENERLISANKARSEFLTIMSHELRTPLTSIIGYSILLKEKKPGKLNDEQAFFVDNILSSSKHLLDLINSILDLAKMEAGKLEMVVEELSVPYIINETLKLLKERAAFHNIVLKTEFDPEIVFIKADRQKFKQILFNLLSNAVKFSKEEGGIITVSVERSEEMAKISVSDTGIGIREEDIPRLFQKFEQLDSGISRKYEGTGIGLSITKQLVEMHGGKIFVESKYGEGSTFIVLLPIAGVSKVT